MKQEEIDNIRIAPTNAAASILAGHAAADISKRYEIDVSTFPVPVLLGDKAVQISTLEHLMERPVRQKGSLSFPDVTSFCAYVKEFGDEPRLFANPSSGRVLAILDYHEGGFTPDGEKVGPGKPGWQEHKATLTLEPAPEWKAWLGSNNRQIAQAAFAEFLEDNLDDIAEPASADILSAAQHLEATKTVEFKSGINLTDGTIQLLFDEAVQSRGKGELKIPDRFVLGLRVFKHGPKRYRVDARLRYRIHEGKLHFQYVLKKPDDVQEAAFLEVLDTIRESTGLDVWLGSPGGGL